MSDTPRTDDFVGCYSPGGMNGEVDIKVRFQRVADFARGLEDELAKVQQYNHEYMQSQVKLVLERNQLSGRVEQLRTALDMVQKYPGKAANRGVRTPDAVDEMQRIAYNALWIDEQDL